MRDRALVGLLVLGSAIFLVITLFEQLPIIGWFGAIVSIAAWIWLAREVGRAGGSFAEAGIIGAVTGFVGSLSAWLAQLVSLFGPATPGLARFGAVLGAVGATIFLFVWPVIGALVCAGAAVVLTRRLTADR
ncbi:MAG TPA: hypothetical protein VF998_02890 [Candidatus Limnocylindria bacterium]